MRKYFLYSTLLLLLFISAPIAIRAVTDVESINNEIQSQKKKLEDVQKRVEEFQKKIAEKQAEANSLKRQLAVLDDKISRSKLDLESNQLKLKTVNLQIDALTIEIEAKDDSLNDAKNKTAEVLRQLYLADQQSLLEILILNDNISDFFSQLNYLQELQNTLQININDLQKIKKELEIKEKDMANQKILLLDTKKELEVSRSLLESNYETKDAILKQTKQSESKYQDLLAQAAAEQRQASSDINRLEDELRKKISQNKSALEQLNDTNFIWPVNNVAITAYFHDPGYPFKRYFEHPAIDIRAKQGTLIRASASGIVGRAKDAGMGYSYIMLVHAEGFTTVYGHVNRIDVSDGDFVTKGQIIGATGGTPGTRGAGKLTTGPHLHFEIRYNGLPVDPLDYLP